MTRSDKVACSLTILLLGAVLVPEIRLGLKIFVDLISLGHSPAKTLLLLLFGVSLAVSVHRLPVVGPLPKRVFFTLLPLCMLLSLGQYLWYCRHFKLAPAQWSAMVREGLWTLSRLDHIHTSKAMLSALPRGLGYKTDVGFAFGALFGQWFLALQLLFFLALLALSFVTCLRVLRRRPTGEAISFVLVTFVLVKAAIDGGPLLYEVWAALPVLGWLEARRRGLILGSILLVAYTLSVFFWKPDPWLWVLGRMVPAVALLALPVASQQVKRWAALAVLIVLTVPGLYWWCIPSSRSQPNAFNTLVYGLTPLKEQWKIHIVSPNSLKEVDSPLWNLKNELRDPASGLYLARVQLKTRTNPLEICKTLKLQPVRRPLSWYQGPVRIRAVVELLDGEVTEITSSPLIKNPLYTEDGNRKFLDFTMEPGVNRDLALSLLGPRLTLVREFELLYP